MLDSTFVGWVLSTLLDTLPSMGSHLRVFHNPVGPQGWAILSLANDLGTAGKKRICMEGQKHGWAGTARLSTLNIDLRFIWAR